MKHLRFISLTVLFLVCCSCAKPGSGLEKHVGLYEVVAAKCELSDGLNDPCRDIRFLELVEGGFHGIGPGQIGLVMWRAESPDAQEGSLLYTARNIGDNIQLSRGSDALWLENAIRGEDDPARAFVEREREFFVIEGGVLSVYHFILDRENKATGQVFKRRFYYKLAPALQTDFKSYQFLYP